ncbi:sugar kinase [Dinghuibacter silviterrae]|uniref:2-dehydro-3-deoxygluconokinase n=1 Tax=Dinghuibacter silviterrae TaxID=1539049 RepID=A0A4R8DN34_9BACT|nr:sugar kinase [Dinghuibacter silviterrae]TDW99198.1 2-dehydro-3-deoxygluconokinase [Dinghuibacter silviterrae]
MTSSIVVSFGEILLRMSPMLEGRWLSDASMPVYVGGAEANVACALASWGQPVAYCTAMPDHYLGREMAAYLESRGVDTTPVLWTGNRVGAYYLPQGSDLQHAGVIYDRAHSSFAGLGPGMIDWDLVLQDAGWFHFSAISPALTPSVAALCREGLEAATRKGVRISVDLNYRSKLWQYGVSPVSVMPGLVEYCDLVMGNLWAAESLLGIPVDKDVHQDGNKQRYLDHSVATSEAILRRFPRCGRVAHTFRFEKVAEGLRYYATLFERERAAAAGSAAHGTASAAGRLHVSREFRTDAVVDKVGSGDCFMGGLIYASLQGWDPQQTIDFAAAAAIGKLQEKGDATHQTVSQVRTTIERHA